jgi:hypothetical protein
MRCQCSHLQIQHDWSSGPCQACDCQYLLGGDGYVFPWDGLACGWWCILEKPAENPRNGPLSSLCHSVRKTSKHLRRIVAAVGSQLLLSD